jgi:hypothetical protein
MACSNLTGPPPVKGLATEDLNFVRIGSTVTDRPVMPMARPVLGEDPVVEKRIIAAEGGSLELTFNTDSAALTFNLEIPADALPGDADISLGLASEEYLVVDLGPEGTVFNVPVKLKLRAESLDLSDRIGDKIKMYWYNPETGLWEAQSATVETESTGGIIESEIELHHFSIYAWA